MAALVAELTKGAEMARKKTADNTHELDEDAVADLKHQIGQIRDASQAAGVWSQSAVDECRRIAAELQEMGADVSEPFIAQYLDAA